MVDIVIKRNDKTDILSLPFYEIQNVCTVMVKAALYDPEYKEIYENKYVNKITKFSKELAFCLNELKMDIFIKDPFMLGKDEVLFSNGFRNYLASYQYAMTHNRREINNDEVGFPTLTDELIKLDNIIEDVDSLGTGIIDNECFVSNDVLKNKEQFAQLFLMNELIRNEEIYNTFINNKDKYIRGNSVSVQEFLVKELGYAITYRLPDGTINIFCGEKACDNAKRVADMISDTKILIDTLSNLKKQRDELQKNR